jgi:hypothetical protein
LRWGAAPCGEQPFRIFKGIDDGGARHAYQSSHRNSLWAAR